MSLKFGILGLLADQPLHGYEVKARFEELLGGIWEVNIGQIYTTLRRLERDGLVAAAGKRGDRGKYAYGLTEGGLGALKKWLRDPEHEPQHLRDEIYVKLLLAGRLGNGNPESLLARQRRVYLQRLRDLAELERRSREEGRQDLALLVQGAILHSEADLAWVDLGAEVLSHKARTCR
jgi:DNA-binding PadR family transcriptional regulator